MSFSVKKIFSTTVLAGGIVLSAVYFLACLSPYISPVRWGVIALLALGFPILLGLMVCWVLIAFVFYKKKGWVFLIVLLLGYQNIFSVIGFNRPKEFIAQKADGALRFMSWNVADFVDSQVYTDTPGNVRRDMMALIANMQADVLCIQDFADRGQPGYRSSLQDVIKAGGYPYYYFSIENITAATEWKNSYGTALLSKYPIIDSGKTGYLGKLFQGALAYIDIKHGKDTVRFYGTHLQSMYLNFDKNATTDYAYLEADSAIIMQEKSVAKKLIYFGKTHAKEAIIAKNAMNQCKYPYVFCGDLNSVPSSYTYHTLKKGMSDVFIQHGFGLGQTYDAISPTLRIDVVFTSKQWKSLQYYSPRLKASDHFPIITDLQLK